VNRLSKYFFLFLFFILLSSCAPSYKYNQNKLLFHKQIAKIYLQNHRYSEALRELNWAIEADKCDPEIYNLLGLAYMGKKEYQKAEECFWQAIKLKPDYSEAYNNLGCLKMEQGKFLEAIAYFKKALSNPLYEHSYIAKTNLGWAYYQLNDKKKAIETLISATKENYRYYKAFVKLAIIYMDEGNLDLAEFYLKKAVKTNRSAVEPRYYLGNLYFEKKNFKLAKKLWESVIVLAPDSPWANLASQKLFLLEKLTKKK